ncbi:MAG: hypothetical protein ABFC56_06680 [Clostridiaceae bacterium]
MMEQKQMGEDLPRDPEKNPPESLEELEALIKKLQEKSDTIKQQLVMVEIREKQGLSVDYSRVKRSIYARAQTNRSISALQRIAKERRRKLASAGALSFEKAFFLAAKEMLDTELFKNVLARTFTLMPQEMQKVQ